MAVTHLAGDRVVIGQYAIQRCMLCGEVLDEFNARNMASPDGETPAAFSLGGFYEVDGNRTSLVRQADGPGFESDLDLPENCCIRSRW
jgi:hypothetical protein